MFIGLSLSPEVNVICTDLVEMDLDGKLGGEIKAVIPIFEIGNIDCRHSCDKCLDGEFLYKAELSAKASILKKHFEAKKELLKWEKKAGDFYYSFTHNQGGLGSCPYKQIRIVVTVIDCEKNPVEGQMIYCGKEEKGKTDENGLLELWLPSGVYDLAIKSTIGENKTFTKRISVGEEKVEVDFQLDGQPGTSTQQPKTSEEPQLDGEFDVTAHGVEVDSGDCGVDGDNVKYILYEDGTLYIYGSGQVENYSLTYNYDGVDTIDYLDVNTPWNRRAINNVFIDKGVVNIGSYMFCGDYKLEKIQLSNNIKDIGQGAFMSCSRLNTIGLPQNLITIGQNAFRNSGLKEVQIPDTVLTIEDGAFAYCKNIKEVFIPNGVKNIAEQLLFACDNLESATLPDEVTSIESLSFGSCRSLVNINLPSKLNSIGIGAFSSCEKLVEIQIPDGVETIQKSAFARCYNLSNVHLSSDLKVIGEQSFEWCKNLQNIIIPNNVKKIEAEAFLGCTSFTEIHIPESVISIGWYAFGGCENVSNVFIPASVTNIETMVFQDCSKDLVIHAPSGSYAESYAKENNITFSAAASTVTYTDTINITPYMASTDSLRTVTYDNAKAGEKYLFLVVKDENAQDLLSADNLLYIDQKTAQSSGSLMFSYIPREQTVTYKELVLEGKSSESILLGDINSDGEIDLQDVQLALQAYLEIVFLTKEQEKAADMNGDGSVDLQDVQMILQMYLMG